MSKNCSIMKRMKENYETRSRTFLTRRTPVIIRLDGKAFHTYTKGLDKPFDEGLIEDMAETAKFLCREIQGAKCAYVQSDEISILITDYDKLTSDAWFDYSVQKMCSISASLVSVKFNRLRRNRFINERYNSELEHERFWGNYTDDDYDFLDLKMAYFDSRVFNIPKEEVPNYFLARQKDAVKNSISMLAQSLYSHKELHKKNQSDLQEMCFQKGHNWNNLHYTKKRGSFIVKNTYIGGIGLHERDERGNKKVEFSPDTQNYAIFDDNLGYWVDLEGAAVRSRWESVETPMNFNEENFSKWI